jgi:hypothetical protein
MPLRKRTKDVLATPEDPITKILRASVRRFADAKLRSKTFTNDQTGWPIRITKQGGGT